VGRRRRHQGADMADTPVFL